MSKDNPIVSESDGRRKGLAGPNYTQVPNDIMDRWLPDLTGAELKVLLYLARWTFGFHRDRVEVGLRRICSGRPGKDRGTGLHIETASIAVKNLEAKGLVIPQRRRGGRTTYTLPIVDVYGESEHPSTENPNRRVFGKSAHEERKSSSETNTQKERRGLTTELGQARQTAAPRLRTNAKNNSMKADDEEPKQRLRYTSPEDELRDIHRTKTGVEIAPDLLSRLKETCELRGATLAEYVEAIRPHTPNAWSNPAGFMTDFARKIRSKTPGGNPNLRLTRIDTTIKETARCRECGGVGTQNGKYCDCQLGQDLKRVEQQRAARQPNSTPVQLPDKNGLLRFQHGRCDRRR